MENSENEQSAGTFSDRRNRPRSASLQSDNNNHTWAIPTFQLTTTGSHSTQHSVFPPSIPSIPSPTHPHFMSEHPLDQPQQQPQPMHYEANPVDTQSIAPSLATSTSDESAYDEDIEDDDESTISQEKEKGTIFQIGRRLRRNKKSAEKDECSNIVDTDPLDDNKNIRRFSRPAVGAADGHDLSSARQVSNDTLVEAALDQAEAQDRHVRFTDHLAEAGNLVQNMLNSGLNSPNLAASNAVSEGRRQTPIQEHDEEELGSTAPSNTAPTSNSVLASLIKLEAQRRTSIARNERKRSEKKKKKRLSKIRRPVSLYDLKQETKGQPQASNVEKLGPPKRPTLTHRSSSWLSNITASNHLVPSLQKRKMEASSINMSRRSSIDSMFTTASQFEPITLEDRIRITFEIANILQKQEFLRKLVKCLMLYGAPAHRLEYILREVSRTLGVDAEYIYIPNVMFLTFFDKSTHTTETHFIRSPQSFDMHKLGEIYRLEKLVSHGEVSVDEALEFIDKVANDPPFYPIWLTPIAYGLASFCGCVMFYGGQFKEGGVAAALGMFFALYELYTGRYVSFQPIWEITVCILIGFVSRALWRFEFCFTPVAFASFIVILPGYSMAVAIIELVSRQLVSGVVRMVYAIIYSFLLGYGIEMGSEIFGAIKPESVSAQSAGCTNALSSTTCVTIIPQLYYIMTVPLFALAYCIYLKARPARWPTMIIVAASGFVVNYLLSCYATAPSQVLQVVPAFTVGFLGNLLTKFTGKMSLDAVILGIFYMVPGSLGLKAALGFFGGTDSSEFSNQGAGFALSMIETSIGITIGLFIATLIVYPKGSQHTPLMNF